MQITGDLWDGTFFFIVSVIGWIDDGSCNADNIAGAIYFILLRYDDFDFFLFVP